jgi:hypothetical protein
MSALFRSRRGLAALCAASGAAAALLWTKVLADAWPTLFLQGTICGRPEGLFGHCPYCFPAAALTGVALAAGAALLTAGKRIAPCKC